MAACSSESQERGKLTSEWQGEVIQPGDGQELICIHTPATWMSRQFFAPKLIYLFFFLTYLSFYFHDLFAVSPICLSTESYQVIGKWLKKQDVCQGIR